VSRNHRKPRTRTRTPRLRRTLASLSLAAAAVTTGLAASDNLTATSGTSGTAVWGAPDTDLTVATSDLGVDVGATVTGDAGTIGAGVTVTPLDTAWG
jgi:hypothetical protein